MKKQTKDAGLEYLKIAGIRAAKDRNSLIRDMERAFGKAETEKFFTEFNKLSQNGDALSYDIKNNNFDRAILFTGSFDGDIIRKCCNWLDKNKDLFGKNILDVGCDCGFLTCFLGMKLPDAHILSIDRSENSIKTAKKFAEKLGVKNITFVHSELSDLEEKDFDTVFSMRTMTENAECIEDAKATFISQTENFRASLKSYAELLASKVKDGGNLVTIESMKRDALMAGWVEALYDSGFTGLAETYQPLVCKELGETNNYQALILTGKTPDEKGMDFFLRLCDSADDYDGYDFDKWEAKRIYETRRGELIDGFTVTGPGAKIGSVFSLWTVNNDPDKIIFYQSHEDEPMLQIHRMSYRAEVEKTMYSCLENTEKYPSLIVEKL